MTDERKALYWLSVSGLSTEKQNKLLEIYGTALEIFDAFPTDKLREFVGKNYEKMKKLHDEDALNKVLYDITKKGVKLVARGYGDYPSMLNQREVAPPSVLYCKGNTALFNTPCVTVVGTRRSSDYGKRVANEWCASLASKFTVVSGHATGIDTYAVKSCLSAGGSAIVVLACGIDKFDLPEYLQKAPEDKLLLVTEYAFGTSVAKFSYHERNRLLSGLSKAVVVVEAGEKSGALITAERACEQNRHVFAVPGDVFSDRSKGTNNLLRNGAIIATSVKDIFEDLGESYSDKKTEDFDLTDDERKVYEFLRDGARQFDDIVNALGASPFEVSSLLSVMELEGIIEKRMQNFFALL